MGGYCSGRQGWREKCEGVLSIDVRRWAREGYLASPRYFGWRWDLNGGGSASIGATVRNSCIELRYNKDGNPYDYTVWLQRTPCHFGGERVWFRCPTSTCGRLAAKLYLGNRYFACRRCYNLAYRSQCYSAHDRALVQAGKIRRRLGGEEGIAWPFPDKPKRMRWRTYERLRVRCEAYEEVADARLFGIMARWLQR